MFKKTLLLVFTSLFLGACTLPSFGNLLKKQNSGLQVTATPPATVFLDGNSLGTTPILKEDLKPGSHTVKIVPTDTTLQPWETQLNLTPGVLSVIDRTTGNSLETSHGYLLSFEAISDKNTSPITITTIPDSVTITIDGAPQGFTPISIDTIPAGDHTISLTSPGYADKRISVKTINGYRLTLSAQLAKTDTTDLNLPDLNPIDATPSADISPTPTPTSTSTTTDITPQPASSSSAVKKPYVLIADTPTGWLRVRETPSGAEVAKVNSGEKFPYLDTQDGWLKLEYATGKSGWVSGQYASVVK